MPKRIYKSPSGHILKKYTRWQYAKLLSHITNQSQEIPAKINIENRVYKVIPHSHKTNKTTGCIYKASLVDERYRFDATKDPHSAFNIFIECYENGYYPPDDVVSFLSDKFKEYLNNDESIDKTFKVNKRAKNNYKLFCRNRDIIIDIDTLKYRLNIKLKDAIDAVISKYEELGIELGIDSVTKIYMKEINSQSAEGLMYLHSQLFDNYKDDEEDADIQIEFEINDYLMDILDQFPAEVVEYLSNEYKDINSLIQSFNNAPVEKLESESFNCF